MITLPVVLLIGVIYGFTFINGLHDGCNVIAAITASRSMPPKKALIIAAVTEFIAPLITGTAVASTIGKGIVKSELIYSSGNTAYLFILCAVLGSIIWNVITWRLGLPSSSSHALIGGLIGSGICVFGPSSIEWMNIVVKVILMLVLTPILGFVIGMLLMLLTSCLCKRCNYKINKFFKSCQTISMIFLATSHSTNDAQKSMGIVTLVLIISGTQNQFYVPFWVKLMSAFFIALGLYLGGWKIVKTVGRGIFKMKPIHSFVSQVSAAAIIFLSGILGSPVSTSQIVSSSIMGVGSGERMSGVKWSVVKNIIISWITTIPAAALFSVFIYFIITQF